MSESFVDLVIYQSLSQQSTSARMTRQMIKIRALILGIILVMKVTTIILLIAGLVMKRLLRLRQRN
ncbi:hypothetical protein KS18_05385 [Photorhabdus luminescens]|nr:hypothetical protein KS18_05385 [Photorhabdus luminescens]